VPEATITKLVKGQEVSIQFPSISGENFNGTIERVAFASGQSPTYPVSVLINKPTREIRPGMAADVRFMLKPADGTYAGIVAPVAAVAKDAEGNYVFVLQKDSASNYRVEKRSILVGDLFTEGFEIESGLEENELVATAGLSFLSDGMKVKLLEE
jgi:hypothetical protein